MAPSTYRPGIANQCGSCGEDFASVRGFDEHRVGKHEYLYSPERPDGRRCLSVEEIRAAGYVQNTRGRWADPAGAERARKAFRHTAERP